MNFPVSHNSQKHVNQGAPTATHQGRFIQVLNANSKEYEGIMRGMPNARFNRGKWACSPTPLTAWQLKESGFLVDEKLNALAADWDRMQLPPNVEHLRNVCNSLKTMPWKHQKRALMFCENKPATLLAAGLGSGKSFMSIAMLSVWQARMVLVVCPKAVLGVWRREMARHCPVSHNVTVLDDDNSKKKLAAIRAAYEDASKYAITMVVVNYESAWRSEIAKLLLLPEWDVAIADESHRIADAGSKQSKFMAQVGLRSKRKLALSGTPMRNNAFCLFGQFKFLEPAIFGTSIDRCKKNYFLTDKNYGTVEGFLNEDVESEFLSRYAAITFRVETKDVIDLPECIHIRIPVKLSKPTRTMYEKLKKDSLLEIAQGEITATNAAVKLMRLQQVACGHSNTEDGQVVRLGDEKKQALKDLISDLPFREPVVVFAKFTQDLLQVREVASELGLRYGEVSGKQNDLTKNAQMPENVDIMGVQIRSGAAGIELTKAAYAFCFSVDFSYADYLQMLARVHRPSQTRTTRIYHLTAANTVDGHIYRALQNKEDAIESVLSALKNGVED